MKSKKYVVKRLDPGNVIVSVLVKEGDSVEDMGAYSLTPEASLKVMNHSPTGFEFSYRGAGPSQLSLSILLDYFKSPQSALHFYQDFKDSFIAVVKGEQFEISDEDIDQWVRSKKETLNQSYGSIGYRK